MWISVLVLSIKSVRLLVFSLLVFLYEGKVRVDQPAERDWLQFLDIFSVLNLLISRNLLF